MEQQRAETGEQQRGRYAQSSKGGHEHRCAEHGEHMLEAEYDCLGPTKLASGVVNAFVFLVHCESYLLRDD